LLETVVALAILSIVLSIALPASGEPIRHARVNRATGVVQMDLRRAYSLAARQRRPVRIAFDAAARSYVFTDIESGDTLHSRSFGEKSEFDLSAMTVTTSPVDIAPSGFASSGLTVTLGVDGFERQVAMLRAGLVREVR
jgi:Tfp pilus assembly protein FimT